MRRNSIVCRYSSPNIIRMIKSRRMRWVGHIWVKREIVQNSLFGKPEGMRPLRRMRRRWEDNIKTDLREDRWDDVD
jgi:hypothetical protein